MATQSSLRKTSNPKFAFILKKMKQWDTEDATTRYRSAMQNPGAYPHETAMINAANMVAAMRLSRIKLLGITMALQEQQRKQGQLGALIEQLESKKESDAEQLNEQEPEVENQVKKEKKLQERLFEERPELEVLPEQKELEEHAKSATKKMEDVEKNIDKLVDKKQQIKTLDSKIENEVNEIKKLQEEHPKQFEKAYGHKLSNTEKDFLEGGAVTESFLKQYSELATPELEARREALYQALNKAHPNQSPSDKNYSQFREIQLQRTAMLLAIKGHDPVAIKANDHTKALDKSWNAEYNHRAEVDKLLEKRSGLAQDAKELVNANDGLMKEIQDSYSKMKECASAIDAKQNKKNELKADGRQESPKAQESPKVQESPKAQESSKAQESLKNQFNYINEAIESYQKAVKEDVHLMDHPVYAEMKGLKDFMAQNKDLIENYLQNMKQEALAGAKHGPKR